MNRSTFKVHITRMCRFAITSASGASINLGLPILLHEVLGISLNMSIASGFTISVLVNFILLRSYVFKGRNSVVSDGSSYLLTNASFRIVEYGLCIGLIEWFGVHYIFSILMVLTASTLCKFFAYQRIFSASPE